VAEEDDALLCQEGVDENDDGVGICAVGCKVGMEGEWLRLCGVGRGEGLDELDEGEVAHHLGAECGRHFDWHGYAVVVDLGLKFVRVSRHTVRLLALRGRIRRRFERVTFRVLSLPLSDHLLELLDEHVLGVACVEHKVLE
jgi:hypothetical protein